MGQTLDKTMGESYAPRVRKHLTGIELERLIAAIKGSRNEKRDCCRVLHVRRLKGGLSATQPLRGGGAEGD